MSYTKAIYASTSIIMVMTIAGVNAANTGDCPAIPIKDIATAACSSPAQPYTTGALSKVLFYAKTPCPSSGQMVGLRKMLQSVFKGAKDYTPTGQQTIPGEVTCTYTIDKTWQEALNTTDGTLVLTAPLPTRDHVNYLEAPLVGIKCPSPTVNDIKKGTIQIEKTKDPKLNYTFTVGKLKGGGGVGWVKNLVGKTPQLSNLTGTMNITKNFTVNCKYVYKIGDKETPLELEGSNSISK